MKIVALEEHFATAEVMQGWKSVDPRWSDLALKPSTEGEGARRLLDLGAERLDAMNEAGIDVLSLTTPGVQNLDAKVAVDLAIFQRSPCLGSSYHAGATPGSFGRSSKRPKRCGFHFTCTSNHQQGLDAYYKGFGEDIDSLFARAGIGWHYETGIQIIRMILAGVFDCFPNLTLKWEGVRSLAYTNNGRCSRKAQRLPKSLGL